MKTATRTLWLALALLVGLISGQDGFSLKDGDRVVFFGDSITQQRLYTTFVETYAVTRFPDRNIAFIHSGWGGDRVTGGGGGGIAVRLSRDVLAYHPTVVTIMLGMNDGRYRPMNDQIFEIYSKGYEAIVDRLKKDAPNARITVIQPSPYDDVTRAPKFPGGYNEVLLKYSEFLADLAKKQNLTIADLNQPVTAMLAKAKADGGDLSEKIIPDRVHPGPAGHLIMAEGLLKAWNAPAVVSAVEIDAAGQKVANQQNTAVAGLQFAKGLAWTQTDRALPMPVDLEDPVMALALRSSDFQESLNRQMLKVTGLAPGHHTLRIDGEEMGTWTAEELANGLNLSGVQTPMWAQAERVHLLTLKHNDIHFARWRSVQVPLEGEEVPSLQNALAALDAVEDDLVRAQRRLAQPKSHQFELLPGDSRFQTIFNGKDLLGWHSSTVNHHGNTHWTVQDGVLTGTQDQPGNGGILLTDKRYANFEVTLELNPDYGCDSGLFLRSNEKGEAYQVLLDYLDGGAIGGVYGERLKGVTTYVPQWQQAWKRGQWNHLRARIEGDVPHIQVWLNGLQITDWHDTANHAAGGATSGMIAVQVHRGNRWIPGGEHRFRNIQVRELP